MPVCIILKKRQTAPIPLSNAFEPPLINLRNVNNMNKFVTDDNCRHVSTNVQVKLSFETTHGYGKIVMYLKTNEANFNTF
jgi:hypothetical protein